jgi:hypothetical protein
VCFIYEKKREFQFIGQNDDEEEEDPNFISSIFETRLYI